MSWVTHLLAAILALPIPWGGPEDSGRRERLTMIVDVAVQITADSKGWNDWTAQQRAALLLAKLAAESGGFRLDVHDGSKRSDHGESVCLGQVHWGPWTKLTRAQWLALGGVDEASTMRCLTEVWRQLGMHKRMCAPGAPTLPGVARLYSSYGSGQGCQVRSWALPRARRWQRMAAP